MSRRGKKPRSTKPTPALGPQRPADEAGKSDAEQPAQWSLAERVWAAILAVSIATGLVMTWVMPA